jgi:uncharacterized protein DUF6062
MKRRKPTARPPHRDLQYHELLDTLGERGCPICRRAEESVEDAIRAILHEQVNDPGFRQEWLATGGFCRHHAWRLVAHHDILGTAILYRALLADAGKHRQPTARCWLCRSYESTERRALETFARSIGDPAFDEKLGASDGLCAAHLKMALQRSGNDPRLKEFQQHSRHRLQRHLDELIRKQDYRFRGEPEEGEGDSWIRAVSVVVGIDLKSLPRRRSRKLPPSSRTRPDR